VWHQIDLKRAPKVGGIAGFSPKLNENKYQKWGRELGFGGHLGEIEGEKRQDEWRGYN